MDGRRHAMFLNQALSMSDITISLLLLSLLAIVSVIINLDDDFLDPS